MNNKVYDTIIVGAGPAGAGAAVYSARKSLKSLLITDSFGGQSVVSPEIYNWIGEKAISGFDLAKKLENHARAYAGEFLEIIDTAKVEKITKTNAQEDNFPVFELTSDDNEKYLAKSVLITSGSSRKKLAAKGSTDFENRGVYYCASCDGPLFAKKDTVVIGAGNAGFETAAQLSAYAKSVTILQYNDVVKADELTVKAVLAHPNVKLILNAETVEIKGEKLASALVYKDVKTSELIELPASGVFVEIGSIPNTDLVKGLVEIDQYNRIKVDGKNQRTSVNGIWAAGDCTDGLYHQNNIATGDGVKALEDIYLYLKARK